MADSGGGSKKSDSMEMFDLIVSDNFEKESSDKLPNSGPTDYLYSGGSGVGGNTTRRSQHDENNVELYDIIARDNFHTYEISDSAQISDTVLSNLPGGVVDSLKPAANVTNTPVLPISQTPSESSEEYAQLVGHCEETSERLRVKSELRKSNTMPVRDESKLSKLDSSLKKNSAFVKKLKNFTSQQLDSLLKDLALLNLSKYMSEVTSALVEVKLKLTDIPSVLSLCSELHRVYAEFSKLFFDQWSRTLSLKKDDKVANLSKLRVDLRFYGDLISCGIFQTKEAFCLLGNVLTFLTATDKEEHNNLSIITSFCKYCGEDFAGLVPKHIQSLARKYNMTVPKSDLIPAEKQKNVKLLLVEYFYSLCRHLLRYNSELKSFEKQNQRILASKGELRQERRDQFESQVGLLKKLTSSAETFADLLGETLPDIPKDKCVGDESNMTGSIVSICGTESEDGGMNFNSIWDDEEMQSFYQDIPYLKDFLPHLKVKVSSPVDGEEPWKSKGTPTAEEMISDDKIDEEINKLTQLDEENVNPDQQPNDTMLISMPFFAITGTPTAEEMFSDDKIDEEINKLTQLDEENVNPDQQPNDTMLDHDTTSDQPNDGETKENDQVIEDKVEDAKEVGGGGDKEKEQSPVTSELSAPGGFNMNNVVKGAGGIDSYLANLYKCENREMIDNAAIEFIMYHNTRTNRKKLTNTLLFVPRTRLDLLPFLSRFVAILYPFQPDISTDLTTLLKNDFKYHTKKKDQINIESKIKNVRYIGELVKFKLYSKIEVLYCLKVLLNDFAHHHVEMCCHLLETCGRYLYRNKDTHARIKIYLEQMIRKRTVLNLDARYNMMIENAFYCVNPPEVPVSKKKDKPVMQLFIEKIVYGDLMNALDNQKDTEAKVLTQLLKLDWNDEQVVKYVVRVFSQPWRVKYDLIRKLANVLAGLVEYEEGEGPGVQVVDNVTEDIRACLETNHPRHNQRRLAVLKYFGELYNYRLIESNDVFKVLYSLITFGVTQTDNGTNGSLGAGGTGNSTIPLLMCDPPENLFRIKLVCVLLETCGQYFSHGATRTKLDYFVVFFQTYFWSKVSHPLWKDRRDVTSISIANYNREVLTALRPNIRLAKDYEEAVKASAKLLAKLPLGEITNTREGEERGGGGK
uniref:Regulator of nonsense transcripts 2 n=1 Tax=Cacopsylla melanoneura TaxID=428564 RepID=A0A8D8ZIF7_9HEMI